MATLEQPRTRPEKVKFSFEKKKLHDEFFHRNESKKKKMSTKILNSKIEFVILKNILKKQQQLKRPSMFQLNNLNRLSMFQLNNNSNQMKRSLILHLNNPNPLLIFRSTRLSILSMKQKSNHQLKRSSVQQQKQTLKIVKK